MFGKIELAEFKELTSMPQKAATAWAGFEELGLVGAGYKPLLYLGSQVVKGTNHFFVAEQNLITNPPVRKVVLMAINEYNGKFELARVEDIL